VPHQRRCALLIAASLLAPSIHSGVRAAAAPDATKAPGEVDFAISCGPDAQKAFRQAVWTLHSFWYPEALKAFTAITEAEPDCAMGYWGIAMSHWYPLWFPPGPAALQAGFSAAEKATAAGPKTEREKDYIAAIATFYRDGDKIDHQTRTIAYEKAMEQVYLRYTEDREAAAFYGLALNASAPATDKTYANKQKAARILNKVWADQPNHPGAVHYLIHSDDTAQFAQAGLDAAICYSKIAPDVPHALHMPSHIFTRLGLWRQSIDSNRAAHTAALAYVQQTFGPDSFDSETVHTMDYLVYAYLQTSQDQQATAIVDELLAFRRSAGANLPAAYAVAAIPVRLVLEHRDWPAAAALGAPAVGFPLERFPWAEAMISFARALGSARTGDIPSAQVEIARLQTLKEQLSAANDAYWANQVEVERLAASGVLAHAQGDDRTALALTRAAADLDATMDKHPATPAPVLPARELLADVLLEVNQPREALNEYELSLRTEPNRFRSILGKARAARQLGDLSLSRDAYQSLVILSTQAPSQRPEVLEAEAFLAN
jgi:hypothetical protein